MTSMRSRWVERMTEREVHRKVLHEDDPDAMAVSDEEVRDYCYDDRVVKHVTPVAMLGVGGVAVFRLYAAADASATGVCGPDSDLTLEAIFPHFLSSFFSMITTALFWHKGFAGFVKRHYHTICACQLGQLYIMTLASETLIALQRRNVATCAPGPQNAEDSPVWVVLMCGKEMGKYVSIFSSCAMFSMNRAATAKMCTISCVAFVVANVVLGAPPGLILLCTLFQLGVGLSAGYLSNGHLAGLQAEYYASKITRFATEQARDILCTLLPYNVLTKLEAPGGEKLLGTSSSVPAACILFVHTSCVQEQATATDHRSVIAAHAAARNARTLAGSADQGMASQKQFEFLHTMFCKWDTLVERAGAFKYQHVNEWYIVACPRAANPHDDDMQRQPYPQDYVTKMAILAEKILQAATDGNASTPSTGMRIAVKAGIHLGPVAGVVLGKQRSFYALYGDSVNVAARMAQSAAPGKLLASKPFADNLMAPPGVAGAPFVCESQGFKHVKGLGDVESFNVTWKVQHGNQDAATGACLPASTNPVAPSRERRGSLSDVLKRTWSGSVRDTQHLHGCPFVAEHTKAGESAGSQRRTRHSTASFESSTAGEHEWGPMEVAASGDKTANCRAINETGNGGLGAATERWLHWLQNGRFKSSGWVGGFPRPLEREFVGFMCGRQGRTETRGLSILLHMVALALQWRSVACFCRLPCLHLDPILR
jgi:class 3 adenylate cyclase